MDRDRLRRHRLRNTVQTTVLVGGMVALVALLGWSLAGIPGLIAAGGAIALLLVMSPRFSSRVELWLVRARALHPADAPGLYQVASALAQRAGLPAIPRLYWVPTPVVQAFTVGAPHDAAIALTDGILRTLNDRELVGVLAHEISHIRHQDMRTAALADGISRLTSLMAFVGWILLAVNLPLVFLGKSTIPWLAVALLIVAPTVSALLQLAVSRAREYDADVGAVDLTGDPEGLASALAKIEQIHRPFWRRVFVPGADSPEPSLLRTHPASVERIKRLLALKAPAVPSLSASPDAMVLPEVLPPLPRSRQRPLVVIVLGPGQTRPRGRWVG